jgi:glycerol-3-phosphate O-acyltransferase
MEQTFNSGNRTYPLPYILEDIREWPIYKLSQDRESFTGEVKQRTKEKIKAKYKSDAALRDELTRVLYNERVRLTEKAWKADPKDEGSFWSSIKGKIIKLDQPDTGITADAIVDDILDRYVEEITGNFDISTFSLARTILPQFFGRVLNAAPGKWFKTISQNAKTIHEKIPITGNVDRIRHLASKGTLVVVPTHFSNMDSIMIGWVLNELGLPAFTYGAGLNLFSIRILSYFMNKLGAYKVDRRKKNSVYLETLKSYSCVALERGAHSIFFPGGTRSRSGSIERKLKLGLLGTAVEAQKNNYKKFPEQIAPKIYVVPMNINYHFVLEASGLINDYLKEMGQYRFLKENDEYSTSYKMARFILKFLSASSSLTISFGNVMDVFGNEVDDDGNSFNHLGNPINTKNYFITNGELRDDQQRDEEYTKILAEKIVDNYARFNTVLTSHLVCFSLFELIKKKYTTVDLFTLMRTPDQDIFIPEADLHETIGKLKERIKEMVAAEEIQMSAEIRWNTEKIIDHGMKNINLYHTANPIKKMSGGYGTEDLKLLYYYRNRLDGYGLEKFV